MNILEKEVEDLIYNAALRNPESVNDKGLYVPLSPIWFRQLNLGSYGIADLVAVSIYKKVGGYRTISVDVYELKKEVINVGVLLQAVGYAKAIEQLIGDRLKNTSISFKFHLVGKKIDTYGNFVYMTDMLPNIFLYEYRLDFFEGMTFGRMRGYAQTKPTLPPLSKFETDIRLQLQERVGASFSFDPFPEEPVQENECASIEDIPF